MDTIVAMFSQYCSNKFEVEICEVVYPDGLRFATPELQYTSRTVSVDKIR